MSAPATIGGASSIRDFLSGGGELGALIRAFHWAHDAARAARLLAAKPEDGDPDHADLAPADLDRLGRRT